MPEYIFETKRPIDEYTCNLPEKINGELIRCKGCQNYLQMDCPMGLLHWNAPPPDGYCYKAVKRQVIRAEGGEYRG